MTWLALAKIVSAAIVTPLFAIVILMFLFSPRPDRKGPR